jgi:hypothetical protein
MKRFIMMHKMDAASEAGVLPRAELVAQMGELMKAIAGAGMLEAGEGLQPTSMGVRVRVANGRRTVTRGPFVGENELVASFAMIRAKSVDDAITWATRLVKALGDVDLYIGRVKEPWDIGLMPEPKGNVPRYLIFRKSDAQTESGAAPTPEAQAHTRQVISEMVKAGVLIAAERLLPSSTSIRLTVSNGKHTTVDGPFAESKELIGGYCIVRVPDRAQAVDWAMRFADVVCRYAPADSVELDIRELAEESGFA